MKRHPFVNTNLIQTLEEEIKLFEQGKSNVDQGKAITKGALCIAKVRDDPDSEFSKKAVSFNNTIQQKLVWHI